MMWPWKVPKWLWFRPEVAVKACQDLATLAEAPLHTFKCLLLTMINILNGNQKYKSTSNSHQNYSLITTHEHEQFKTFTVLHLSKTFPAKAKHIKPFINS
jgi:hypothetical protein